MTRDEGHLQHAGPAPVAGEAALLTAARRALKDNFLKDDSTLCDMKPGAIRKAFTGSLSVADLEELLRIRDKVRSRVHMRKARAK